MNGELILTKNNGKLTIDQRKFYENNGYLVIPKLISQKLLDDCSQRFDDYADGKIEKGSITVMRDIADKKLVNKIQDINHDVVFRRYIENKNILDIVESVIGKNIMAVHNMLISKPPDAGQNSSRHPPHQDLYYFPFRPANNIVATWTAIEPCNVENGCLFVSPGSHRLNKLYPHGYPKNAIVNKFYHGIQDLPSSMIWIDLEMKPGDTVFFHPLLIHGSGVNKSSRTRKAISCHYAASECSYIDVKGTFQENIEKEILDLMAKRYPGVDIKYQDVWKFKSSLVRGLRSNL
ncbi:hypothetical protein HCN44_009061 [Aphidius gifuensis]|uniref:phytanoyl-CoA dioxygenase n=2 Tax=Aphidius gifuensis TaxID=684658 RepID=A0A834Y1I9_APHGI|nr:hypothetical protein HCN44_009061 [Aphidius gifuensis]